MVAQIKFAMLSTFHEQFRIFVSTIISKGKCICLFVFAFLYQLIRAKEAKIVEEVKRKRCLVTFRHCGCSTLIIQIDAESSIGVKKPLPGWLSESTWGKLAIYPTAACLSSSTFIIFRAPY